jgi:hypothetical protein
VNEPEDKKDEHEDEEDDSQEERPTVAPPFDPVAFAQEVLGGKPSPARGTPAQKRVSSGSKQAAFSSKKTPLGVGRPPMPTLTDPAELEEARQKSATASGPMVRPTPQGLLSLANSRIPSNIPPARKASTTSLSAVDREWEELATSPPPPMQQALIDAMARGEGPTSARQPAPAPAPSPPPSHGFPPVSESSKRTLPPEAPDLSAPPLSAPQAAAAPAPLAATPTPFPTPVPAPPAPSEAPEPAAPSEPPPEAIATPVPAAERPGDERSRRAR